MKLTDYGAVPCPGCGNPQNRHVKGSPCPPRRPGYPDHKSWLYGHLTARGGDADRRLHRS